MRSQITSTTHAVEYNGHQLKVLEIENMDENGITSYLYALGHAAGFTGFYLVEVDKSGDYHLVKDDNGELVDKTAKTTAAAKRVGCQIDNQHFMYKFSGEECAVGITEASYKRMMARGPDGNTPAENCQILPNDGLYGREEAAAQARAAARENERSSRGRGNASTQVNAGSTVGSSSPSTVGVDLQS